MMHTEKEEDVPSNKVEGKIKICKASGAISVEKVTQPNGKFTIIATYEDDAPTGEPSKVEGRGSNTPDRIQVKDVVYTQYAGGGDIDSWIAQACEASGVPPNEAWMQGFKTLCERESSYRPNAVNKTDTNAHGPVVQDGHPQNCSRGVAQCIPSTFAEHHAAGTSVSIYDPVANIAAAIHYVRNRYHVALDGADLAAKVQQADPTRPPKGY